MEKLRCKKLCLWDCYFKCNYDMCLSFLNNKGDEDDKREYFKENGRVRASRG